MILNEKNSKKPCGTRGCTCGCTRGCTCGCTRCCGTRGCTRGCGTRGCGTRGCGTRGCGTRGCTRGCTRRGRAQWAKLFGGLDHSPKRKTGPVNRVAVVFRVDRTNLKFKQNLF